jgi:hypothetical protein
MNVNVSGRRRFLEVGKSHVAHSYKQRQLRSCARFTNYGDKLKQIADSVRIALHVRLAVTLNDHQDYFGQTVNIASRVQGIAVSRSIIATEQVAENTQASALLESSGLSQRSVAPRWLASLMIWRSTRSEMGGVPSNMDYITNTQIFSSLASHLLFVPQVSINQDGQEERGATMCFPGVVCPTLDHHVSWAQSSFATFE